MLAINDCLLLPPVGYLWTCDFLGDVLWWEQREVGRNRLGWPSSLSWCWHDDHLYSAGTDCLKWLQRRVKQLKNNLNELYNIQDEVRKNTYEHTSWRNQICIDWLCRNEHVLISSYRYYKKKLSMPFSKFEPCSSAYITTVRNNNILKN